MVRFLVPQSCLVLLLLLTGCTENLLTPAQPSQTVEQRGIYASYQLTYDVNTDVTAARADFAFGGAFGTQLTLDSRSSVTCNGEPLARKRFLTDTYYQHDFAGRVDEGTFVFIDNDGDRYTNTTALRTIDFPATLPPIDNDGSYEVRWQGAALAADETVTLRLRRPGGPLVVATQRGEGERSIILTAEQLSEVPPGAVTLELMRTVQETARERTRAGGTVAARFIPRDRTVEVVD